MFRRKEAEEYEQESYAAEEEVEQSTLPRWIPSMVVIVALFGFGALAWVAYDSRSNKEEFAEVPLIKNNVAEYRIKPDDEGGMKIAGEDKEIYEAAAGKREKLDDAKIAEEAPASANSNMPAEVASSESEEEIANTRAKMFEEEPSAKASESITAESKSEPKESPKKAIVNASFNSPASGSSTQTNAASTASETHSDKVNEKAAQAAAAKIAAVNENNKPAATSSASTAKEKPAQTTAAAANKPTTSSIVAKAEESAKAVKKTESGKLATAAKSTAKSDVKKQIASSGSNKIQLGAYKTEAEAMQAWKKVLSQNAGSEALKGKPFKIQKVEIPEKGIFYRLQVNGYGDKTKASMACKEIESSSGCFVVQ